MATPACYYGTWGAYALGWTHFLPIFVTTAFSAMSVIYSEVFFLFIGLFFNLSWAALLIAQFYLERWRPDPFCAVYQSYVYPSMETFYAVALLTLVIAYAYTFYERPVKVGVYAWVVVLCIGFVPPFLLTMYRVNTWQETLSTVLIAVIPTVAFILVLRVLVQPRVCFLLISPPWSWWGYESHFLECSDEDRERARRVLRFRNRH